jgi:hypothetical protein
MRGLDDHYRTLLAEYQGQLDAQAAQEEKELSREEMIDWLVDNDLHDWSNSTSKDEYFAHILIFGVKGYQNMTDEEIQSEYKDRQ